MSQQEFKFPFPSNGNAHRKDPDVIRKTKVKVFPFPSNGNAHPKWETQREVLELIEFPFPSNGNAHRKARPVHGRARMGLGVLIPFKRERASQGVILCGKKECFQASIPFKRESRSQVIADAAELLNPQITLVSIPFKRERAFQVYHPDGENWGDTFPFPSNGKGHSK